MLLNILLNLFTVFLICSIAENLFIFFVTFFALVVLNCEILSIFHAFEAKNVLFLSFAEFICVFAVFLKNKGKFYFPFEKIKKECTKIKTALFNDKPLCVLFFGFCTMLFAFFILAFFSPVLEPDARMYHFARVLMYVKQASFLHFNTNSIRNTVLPLNSEMFYSYFYLFKKNDTGYGFLSYFSFLNCAAAIYLTFLKLKIPRKKALFSVFVFSSLPVVLLQIPSLQTDIVVASLFLGAIYLFISAASEQTNKKAQMTCLYFSSLSFALAFGVKTTAFMGSVAVFVLFFSYVLIFRKNFRIFFPFLVFSGVNFLVFSSYNYILNFLEWQNFLAPASFLAEHFPQNFSETFKKLSLDFFGFRAQKEFYDERTTGFLVLGIVAILPAIFLSLFKIKSKNSNEKFAAIAGLTFVLNFLLLCVSIKYFQWSIRFFTGFASISAFSFVFLYERKPLKILITIFAAANLFLYSFFTSRCPLYCFFDADFRDIQKLKENIILNKQTDKNIKKQYEILKNFEKTFKKTDKIAILNDDDFYELKNLTDYDLKFISADEFLGEEIREFDFIILKKFEQINDNFQNKKPAQDSENFYCGYVSRKIKGKEIPLAKKCFFREEIIFDKNFEKFEFKKEGADLFKAYKKSGQI